MKELLRRFVVVFAAALLAAALLAANALADPPTFTEACQSTAKIGAAHECTYTVANDDGTTHAETLTVNSLTDRVHASDGDVAAELLSGLIITPSGGATCNVSGPAAGAGNTSCTLPFGSSIATAPTSIYTVTPGDFLLSGHLLLDDASLSWRGMLTGPGVQSASASTLVAQVTSTTTASIDSDTFATEHASVTVIGEPNNPIPAGDVTIDWFSSNDCTGTPLPFGPAPLAADGTLDAAGFSGSPGGSIRAHYLGDPGTPIYAPSDSACVQSPEPSGGTPITTGTPASPDDLIALIATMSLDTRLADDLTSRAQTAAGRVTNGRDACRTLDLFVKRVADAAGKTQPKLTGAQAKALLDAAYAVEARLGC